MNTALRPVRKLLSETGISLTVSFGDGSIRLGGDTEYA